MIFAGAESAERPWEPLSRYSFGYTQRSKFLEFLKSGNLMFAFAGPPERAALPALQRGNNGDPRAVPFIDAFGRRYGTPVREIGPYFCFLPLKFDAKEENLVPGPAAARFSPHAKYASAFQSYADAFVESMRWDASWDLSQSRNIFGLFANVSGDSVGFVQEYFRLDPERYRKQTPGLLVVLPNINDVEQRTTAIVHLLKYTVPALRPGLLPKWTPPPEPPETWFARYDPPIVASNVELLAQRRAQLESDEQSLREERERLGRYKELIRMKDDRLHELVAEVFRDVFAFEVVNLDDAVPPGGVRGADLTASKNGFSVLIEVKGATNTSLQRQHVFAFITNIERHVREHGTVSARLLVINSEGAKPPEERNAFNQEVIAYAASNGISVMSGVSLFHLVERRLDGTLSDQGLKSQLIEPGLVGH